MRIRSRKGPPAAEGDLTPMIDMTFQLIAFFMLLINFTEAEQDQRVRLPESELAKPPEKTYEKELTVQLTRDDLILFAGEDYRSLEEFDRALSTERSILKKYYEKDPSEVTIVIRADRDAETGKVQELIQRCQLAGFERFAFRSRIGELRPPAAGD